MSLSKDIEQIEQEIKDKEASIKQLWSELKLASKGVKTKEAEGVLDSLKNLKLTSNFEAKLTQQVRNRPLTSVALAVAAGAALSQVGMQLKELLKSEKAKEVEKELLKLALVKLGFWGARKVLNDDLVDLELPERELTRSALLSTIEKANLV